MFALLGSLLRLLVSPANLRDIALENLALRQQLAVFKRKCPRPRLRRTDRFFWVWLSRSWNDWHRALVIVRPETVVAWHRKGFRLFWTWISRRKGGRPEASPAIRALILKMAAANPLWGAPRIHGELLKLGIPISERTVSRLLPRKRRPPSQTWKAFLDNHLNQLVSIDFFTVPTASFRVLFVFVVLAHRRRRVIHFNVTEHPTGGLDRSANPGSIPRRHGATIFDPRPGPDLRRVFPESPQRPGHHRSPDGTAEPLAKSVGGKAGGLHPARMLGSRDRAGREASAKNPEELFRLLSVLENSPIFSQGRSDNSRRAGAGGGTDRGDPAGRRPAPSLRTARCVTDELGPGVPLPRKLQPASRKAGFRQRTGSTSPMTARARDHGTERRAETAVVGRLFFQRMHHYRVLAKNNWLESRCL